MQLRRAEVPSPELHGTKISRKCYENTRFTHRVRPSGERVLPAKTM
jgi:hypothetical protein